jgi:predicted RNase H-like HicB family nuclease
MREYLVVIEAAEDGSGFGAYAPDLPGCVATSQTREEVLERIACSIPLHIQSLQAHGELVAPPTAVAERISVAA